MKVVLIVFLAAVLGGLAYFMRDSIKERFAQPDVAKTPKPEPSPDLREHEAAREPDHELESKSKLGPAGEGEPEPVEAPVEPPAETPPWIQALGSETVVCASPGANPLVRRAAARVVKTLQRVRPDAAVMDPDRLILDYPLIGSDHVIVVGEWHDNVVMRSTWGFWATTKPQREWEARGDAASVAVLGMWERELTPMPWRDRHDLFAFGYGEFDGPDVGYIQTVRNPYTLLKRLAPGQPRMKDPKKEPLRVRLEYPANQMRFMIHITGAGPEGVRRAADAFLEKGLLNAVVPGEAAPLLDEWTLEGLGPEELRAELPPWAPTRDLPDGAQYVGQQIVGSHLYGGFTEVVNVHPVRCWRLKYRVETGFVLYDSYPTNRATGNEVFICELRSDEDAAAATRIWRHRYRGGRVARRGRFVLLQSFADADLGAAVLKAVEGAEWRK